MSTPQMSSYLHASWDNNLKTTSIDGKTAQGEPTSAAQAWTACIEALRKRDEHMIQGWKEDIDTLLVFAGLFSAVITAFIIEAYKLLQQDPQDTMVLLLAQISQQLANSTNEPFSIPAQNNAFPLHFTRRINILWFSSLVLSLAAASIGILVKQWLRDYVLSFTADFPRRRSRIRQFRRQGLIDWKVPGIVMALPVILQVALAFFLGGVVDLLWQLDTVVAAVITAFVAATLAFLIITTILPTFSDECPYTSPQALGIYRIKQWTNDKLVIPILEMVLEPFMPRRARTPWPLFIDPTQIFHPTRAKIRMWFADLQQRRYHRHWRDREKHCVVSREATLDHHTLSSADDYLRDDRFLHDVLRVCINDTDYQVAWDVITDILHNRAHTALGGIPDWKHVDVVHSELSTLIHLVADVLTRIDPKDSSRTLVMIDMLNRLCRALPAKFDRRQPIHVIHLYQRLYRVLAPLLSLSNMPIQKTVFESMRILSSHSSVSVDTIVMEYLIDYAIDSLHLRDTFQATCTMILEFASRDSDIVSQLQEKLKNVFTLLESHFMTPQQTYDTTPSSTSLVITVLDFVKRNSRLINPNLLQAFRRTAKDIQDRTKDHSMPENSKFPTQVLENK